MKFHKNPSIGSQVVPHRQADADMKKLIVASRNFANPPKNDNNKSSNWYARIEIREKRKQ